MAADGRARAGPQTSEQIRAELERTRAELVLSVGELRQEVARRTDWRQWVRERPLTCLGAAFFVGFLLGNSQRR